MTEASQRVLIVDDDRDLCLSISSTLSEAGYDVYQAENGREANEMIVTSPPDLVLLDLMMPNGNGWDVLAKLRATGREREIPVVVISAYASAVPTGARALLRKPVTREDLLGAVAGHALRSR
jgi:twitching motility two-component system response regulator PilH